LYAPVSGVAYPYKSENSYSGFGWHVKIIPHNSPGQYVILSHMSAVSVIKGENVKRGAYLGKSGGNGGYGSGTSTAAHVHMGLHNGNGASKTIGVSTPHLVRVLDIGQGTGSSIAYDGPPEVLASNSVRFKEDCQKSVKYDGYRKTGHAYQSFNTTVPTNLPVHRFYSPVFKSHFYTTSEAERDATQNDSNWEYEGVAFRAEDRRTPNNTPLFRFWSSSNKKHFFTISVAERDYLIKEDDNWEYEGFAFYVLPSNSTVTNANHVHRFYSSQKNGHFYTSSESEKNAIIANDPSWSYEGIGFRALTLR